MRRAALWATVVCGALLGCRATPKDGLRVAAASDLARVLPSLTEAQLLPAASVSYGSSGLLARQLTQGAPFDVFLSADAALVERLAADGTCERATVRQYARGRLVAVGVDGAQELATALSATRVKHLAVANPAHAPYGRAAVQVLSRLGVEAATRDRLVYADNVQQALRFVESGNADVGLVAKSLVLGPGGGARAFVDVPEALHDPLHQAAVACGPARAEAAAFVEALVGAPAQALLAQFGFEPGEPAR